MTQLYFFQGNKIVFSFIVGDEYENSYLCKLYFTKY